VSKLHFLKGILKKCINSYNWFQIFCTIKTCPLHVHWWTWWKTKSYKNFRLLKLWRKRLQGKRLIFLTISLKIVFNGFKMSSFRCKSHVLKINLPKNVWLSIETHFGIFGDFLEFSKFLALNQNIHTQLCMNVKNHH
jgi:hypothetical protein